MSAIPDDVIEQIRDTADIVHLIGQHIDLKRTGSDFRGPCPFHGGQHRNLAVIPKKQMFYCFVCHEGGDVFTFFMKHFGMDYPTAVRDVAARIGVTIPERSSPGPDPNEPLYEAVSAAADWYARQLREHPAGEAARRYLNQRNFDVENHAELGLGYAPKGDTFEKAMLDLGISKEVLLETVLLVKRENGTTRPRFWNRLLFPIHDLRGRIVGFGGRILGDGEPKYLNSSDSPIFHKGRMLYNLHQAKQWIRKEGSAVVVEGYFDVLRLVDVGIENVIASLGTAFTVEQAQLLKRYTDDVAILYDSDKAGQRATFRAADEMLRAGLRVAVATLPEDEDPDSIASRGGAEAVRSIVSDAVDVCERKIQLLERAGRLGTIAGRRKALDKLLPTMRAARDPVTLDLYVSRVCEVLGTSRDSIMREIAAKQPYTRRTKRDPREREEPSERPPGFAFAERSLITVMIHEPGWRPRIAELLPDDEGVLRRPEGDVVLALAKLPVDNPAADALDLVGGEGRSILSILLEQPPVDRELADAIVEQAIDSITRRAREKEIERLDREIPFATGADKDEKIRSKKALLGDDGQQRSRKWKVTDLNR